MNRIVVSIYVTVNFLQSLSAVISGSNSGLVYLSKFGYLPATVTNSESGALLDHNALSEAYKEFQAFAGINVTGVLDEETIKMMNTPRCGVKDKVGFGSIARRKKRYALQGSRWKVKKLTYKITKYPNRLTRSEVDSEIRKAFQVWEDVTDLSFVPVKTGKVQIEIRFESGEHGDGDPFDGRGGTLAHAYFPIYGGDAHFDDDEYWTVKKYSGTNLFQVAAHEFGHSLGLSHSDVRSSLMAPFYKGYQRNFKLDIDDISAIQSLYGEKKTTPSETTAKPSVRGGKPRTSNDLCGSSIDAILNIDDTTYAFKGDMFWKLTDTGIASGYPKKIADTFEGLPSNLDGAFTWTNGKTYYFKGGDYYRFNKFTMDEGYPKKISKGFNGIPDNVDAAFVWGGNGKIYFFKDTRYWKFDPEKKPPVTDRYPKDINIWEGLPNNIDAALRYTNGYTYFFKNGEYWRFNDRLFRVDRDDPSYPRDAGYWWFGCPQSANHVQEEKPDNHDYNDYHGEADDGFSSAVDYGIFSDDYNTISTRSQNYKVNGAESQASHAEYIDIDDTFPPKEDDSFHPRPPIKVNSGASPISSYLSSLLVIPIARILIL